MKVDLNIEGGTCTITKEPGDPRFSGVLNAAGESRLLYHVKQKLNNSGFGFIKKRMWKDGHLVDEMQQYLRERTAKKGQRCLAVYNTHFAIEGADQALNREGSVTFAVVDLGSTN